VKASRTRLSSSKSIISLSNLTTLQIRTEQPAETTDRVVALDLLNYIKTPVLSAFSWVPLERLSMIPHRPGQDLEILRSLCLRSNCDLETLSLPHYALRGDASLVRRYILESFPVVQQFTISPSSYDTDYGCLLPDSVDHNGALPFPQIRELVLKTSHSYGILVWLLEYFEVSLES
jgi:hypothetical protein